MNRRRVIFCLAAASVASAAGAADRQPLDPQTERGLRLFERYRRAPPPGDPIIYVNSDSAHFTAVQAMAIAARDPAGRWTVVSLGEERSAMLTIEPKIIIDENVVLSPEDASRLDQLLASPQLYEEKDSVAQPPGEGGFVHNMEIVGPSGHLVIRWTRRLEGEAGAVADIVIGRA